MTEEGKKAEEGIAWAVGDTVYVWNPTEKDRFAFKRGTIVPVNLRLRHANDNVVSVELDKGNLWWVLPHELHRSPEALRRHILRRDLSRAREALREREARVREMEQALQEPLPSRSEGEAAPDVVCNACGFTCAFREAFRGSREKDLYGLIEAKVEGHYSSRALRDCSRYRFSLCEFCLDALFELFVIPPDVADVGLTYEETNAVPLPFQPFWETRKGGAQHTKSHWRELRRDYAKRSMARRFGEKTSQR